jgi:uncharacterized membrane protein YhhN
MTSQAKIQPALAGLLVFVLLLEYIAFLQLPVPDAAGMGVYRVLHLVEMLLLIGLVAWQFRLRSVESRLILAGLLLSFGGDLVNSYLFNLSILLKPQTLLSIPLFVLAHLCYIACFLRLLRRPPPGRPAVRPWQWLLALVLWPVLALGLWQVVIDPAAPPLMVKLSLGYAFVVMLMGVIAVLLGAVRGRQALWPALGGLLFLISDSLLGAFLLDGPTRPVLVSQAIWITYFMAQVLISRAPQLRAVP